MLFISRLFVDLREGHAYNVEALHDHLERINCDVDKMNGKIDHVSEELKTAKDDLLSLKKLMEKLARLGRDLSHGHLQEAEYQSEVVKRTMEALKGSVATMVCN